MALTVSLLALLDFIIALLALSIVRALKPRKVERDIIRLEGDDVNVHNIADLSRLGYRTMVLRSNLAILVGEFESKRPSHNFQLRLSVV
jgi:hypothetical protein